MYKVEVKQQKRRKPNLIVRHGVISDPCLVLWLSHGAPTADYVPFQDVGNYEYVPAEWRDEYVGA